MAAERLSASNDAVGEAAWAAALTPVLQAAVQCRDGAEYLRQALAELAKRLAPHGIEYLAVVSGREGRWRALAESSNRASPPHALLAHASESESPAHENQWWAAPLKTRDSGEPELLCAAAATADARWPAEAAALAAALGSGLSALRARAAAQRRAARLEAILTIAHQWNKTHEPEPLLRQMAEAAARLLEADRASIFLWDKPRGELVARPALGVPDGELRVADDRGVVGQVLRTGQPRRVDAAEAEAEIDRQVDRRLNYRTRSLLCVPLRGRAGDLFGVFEVLNKQSGRFTAEDEAALIELASHAAVALENAQDRQQLLSSRRQIVDSAAAGVQLIGKSPAIEALRSITRRVADTDLAVLILGENGTGKEIVAQSIHYLSRRRDQPFIAVNCAAIPESLAESELFGHEKGAFTDAHETRPGKFELADGGTLFLDEIGELSLAGQAKLLRVLEEHVFVRVGGSRPITTDARVVAATNQNLAEMVRKKRFREDLYFRLNVVTLELPPLRERPGDVLLLAEHFLNDFCRRARRPVPELTPAARKRLAEHPWPGNVRELRNLMERLAYLSTDDRIDAPDLAFILSPRGTEPLATELGQTLANATADFQCEYIRRTIEKCGGNMSQAAAQLGLHRSNLYRKMRHLGMTVDDEEASSG